METRSIPASVADGMVEQLFSGQQPSRFDDILYPGCGDGTLVAAVHRYCEAHTGYEPPSGVAVDIDTDYAETVATRHDEIEAKVGDYLHEEFILDSQFDYILCDPPTRPWTDFSTEQQSAYASNFGQLTIDDTSIDSHFLFVTQAIRDLNLSGRAVFATPPSLFDSDAATTLREQHYYRIDSLTEFDPDSHASLDSPRLITTLTNDDTDWESTVTAYEPSVHEAALNTSITDVERPFTAAAIMTPNPTGFGIQEDIPMVYVELMAEDFDAAPVYNDPQSETGLQGYVSREQLRTETAATLGEQTQQFTPDVTVKPTAEIGQILTKLSESRFIFIVTDDSIQGIITRFDLNSLPVYTHLYDCFSQFEIGLRELIRSRAPNWNENTDTQIPYRGQRNVVSDRLTCAQLSTLIEIVRELELRTVLPNSSEIGLDNLAYLRNAIAHYNPIIHTMTEQSTHNEPRRGAPQLAAEYDYLHACIDAVDHPQAQ